MFVLYFPSRWDLQQDKTAIDALHAFGANTGGGTSVNIWDPKDPNFEKALELFHLKTPPAIVLTTGLKVPDIQPFGPNKANLYNITFTDSQLLGNTTQLVSAVNAAHEVLVRGNPKEISSYIRGRKLEALLSAVAKIGAQLRDALLAFKPKLGLPGGASIQVG